MRFALALCICVIGSGLKADCGGPFNIFVDGLKAEAAARGYQNTSVDAFFRKVQQDPNVIRVDRNQGFFQKDFIAFSQAVISSDRMRKGRENAQRYADIFRRAERDYGVPAGVLLAFWAL